MSASTLQTVSAGTAHRAVSDGFVLRYVDASGLERQESLEVVADVGFERCRPVREFPSYRGQRNWPGLWWSATMGAHVGFESWLERDHAMALDFDHDVVAFVPQPFWLGFVDEEGRRRWHAPDFFVRRRDGGAVVVDCRPDGRIGPRDAVAFAVTATACAAVGWDYRRAGELDPVRAANLRWLAGYRHPRFADPEVIERLLGVFAVPRPLLAGAELAGTVTRVLPVVFHLMWRQGLRADLTVALSEISRVRAVP